MPIFFWFIGRQILFFNRLTDMTDILCILVVGQRKREKERSQKVKSNTKKVCQKCHICQPRKKSEKGE
jgi:hypothetical protein